MPKILKRDVVFQTPWFELISKTMTKVSSTSQVDEFYSIKTNDYVSVVALTSKEEILLVRQYRPAIEDYSLELPAGHVDQNETPEEAAVRELYEETGYRAKHLKLLGCLAPDTGRLSNKQWCFFAKDAVKDKNASVPVEEEIETVKISKGKLREYILDAKFSHALHLSALYLALLQEDLIL